MTRPKIVIVEDDHHTRRAYEEKFKKIDKYDIVMVADGSLAVELIKQELPDLILLDILLPGLNGFKILTEIKQGETTKNIPVIILSNLGQEEDVQKGMSLGADDYLIKSDVSMHAVEDKIEALLKAKALTD